MLKVEKSVRKVIIQVFGSRGRGREAKSSHTSVNFFQFGQKHETGHYSTAPLSSFPSSHPKQFTSFPLQVNFNNILRAAFVSLYFR